MPEEISHQPVPAKIESLVGRFRKTYILALALLGFLLVALELVTQFALTEQTQDAYLINISGRQRMRSQRLVKEMLLESYDPRSDHAEKARVTGVLLTETHKQLESFVDTPSSRAIYERLTPLVNTLSQSAQATTPSLISTALPDVLEAEAIFLPLMDQLVSVFEVEAQSRLVQQRILQFAILVFLLLTLLLVGLYVFAPMVGSLSDALGRLQKANRTTSEALAKSEAAERMKSSFLTSVSHELKTPMNGILGTSDLLMDCELPPQAKDYVQVIQTSAEQLLGLVDDILDISNLESGALKLNSVGFSFVRLLSEIIESHSLAASQKGLQLHTNLDPELPTLVEGDPVRFKQILNNLLSNAVKYTETGGITLSVGVDAEGIGFEVADTGPGIPPDRLVEMVQPFRQLDEGATRKYQGVGLGLPIVDKLIRLHGAELKIASTENQGTNFLFKLPLRILPVERPTEVALASESRIMDNIGFRFEGRVLVVEDNETNQMVCQRMLRKVGVEVDVAAHGEEALEMLARGTYDLIFMDLQMPVMDGTRAARLIRETDSKTPIVALTANAGSQEREECEKAGMNGFLTKPLRAKALRDLLLDHLKFELTEEEP